MSGNKAITNTDNNHIESEDKHGLLRINIDSKLSFELINHVNKLFKKASQEIDALVRISNYMTFAKRKVIMKAFITS